MKTTFQILLALLLAAPTAVAGELIWVEEDGTTVEPLDLVEGVLKDRHLGFPDNDNGPGTLLKWNFGGQDQGGPNRDAPLVTDRPDFTEASSTVGRRVLQVEFGYTFTMDEEPSGRMHHHSAGEPLLRYGFGADWFELRLAFFPVSQRTDSGGGWSTQGGSRDLYLGTKIALTSQECHYPEMAIILQSTVPSGSRGFTNDEVLPGANLLYSWEVNNAISIGGSTQANRSLDESTNDPYLDIAQSATVVLGLSDKIGMFTEWYAFFPDGADTARVEHYFDGGFTVLLSNDVQFDIRAGYGLSRSADDFFVGTGLSIRFQ
ncbi:MAG: transporter [Planctomycetaceae bacterium]